MDLKVNLHDKAVRRLSVLDRSQQRLVCLPNSLFVGGIFEDMLYPERDTAPTDVRNNDE
jgi:hypothetical protein